MRSAPDLRNYTGVSNFAFKLLRSRGDLAWDELRKAARDFAHPVGDSGGMSESDEQTPLRKFIEEKLGGRSWTWLSKQFPEEERVSATQIRNWADGVYPLKPYRADQLAAALAVTPGTIRRLVGMSLYDTPKDVLDNDPLSDPPGTLTTITKAGGRGEGNLADTERDKIVGVLASIGQQLLDLANEIKSGPPRADSD